MARERTDNKERDGLPVAPLSAKDPFALVAFLQGAGGVRTEPSEETDVTARIRVAAAACPLTSPQSRGS
jgi:hypothetical protein